uniref:RRM domain-containing protein n=1 Tax=Brassica oleracea var. oleracea TaxID=109376 RepID=A0A0D3CTV2_BRAOL
MHDHFIKYGDILKVVIIFDKFTHRSTGYGFVTFKDAEAAKRACEDSTPVINGRRASCNLASLSGSLRRSPTMASPQERHPSSYVAPTPEHDLQSKSWVHWRNLYEWILCTASATTAILYNHHHMYGGGRVMVGTSPMMPLYTFYPCLIISLGQSDFLKLPLRNLFPLIAS